jgi:hypothetical protein
MSERHRLKALHRDDALKNQFTVSGSSGKVGVHSAMENLQMTKSNPILKRLKDAMGVKKTPTRDEVVAFMTDRRASCINEADTLASELTEDNLSCDPASVEDGPNDEVRQWATDLASDMNDWSIASWYLDELNIEAEKKAAA